jgi:hypothetical protein
VSTLMVINNWTIGAPSYQSELTWKYRFTLHAGDYMFPALAGYGDLTNCAGPVPACFGASGQGELTPVEKVFDFHFIVLVPIAPGNQFYDPSYGKTYSSQADFESYAVTGYAIHFGTDGPNSGDYHFKPPTPGAANISFFLNQNNSM